MKNRTQILVIGQGAAGLRAACAAAETGAEVLVVGKGSCASPEIMGFNCVTEPGDSFQCFYEDVMQAGQEINHTALARQLAEGSIHETEFLTSLGVTLDRKVDGSYHTLSTLGCRYPRLVHHQALTGVEEMRRMEQYARELHVEFMPRVTVTDLVVCDGRVCGAACIRNEDGSFFSIQADAVILAAGGGSAIHGVSTYPGICTGDGYAIAARAGATLVDMEFQQFEPCSFVYPEALRGKIVPTTLLRSGARLYNAAGEDFMPRYGLSSSNARKGPLSRAIASEIAAGRGTPHGGVYYDMTMLPRDMIVQGHSIFYVPAKAAGLDITQVPAEMAPASHTFMGGVEAEADTSTGVTGLFVCGEAMGGLHGADRIGGNAGAEVLVFGGQAGRSAAAYLTQNAQTVSGTQFQDAVRAFEARHAGYLSRTSGTPVSELRARLMKLMDRHVGILRDEAGLLTALSGLDRLESAFADACSGGGSGVRSLYEFSNMLLLGRMQVMASFLRTESRGVFNRTDHPDRDDSAWKKNIVFHLKNGRPVPVVRDCR